MKNLIVLFFALLIYHSCFTQTTLNDLSTHSVILNDQYGRIIKDAQDKKYNYSFEQNYDSREGIGKVKTNEQTPVIASETVFAANPNWKFTIMGKAIGRKSLYSGDLDGDGKTEILCSALVDAYTQSSYVWYTLEFDPSNLTYNQDFVSALFINQITRIKIYDINNDGILEIIVGTNDGKITIYKSLNKEIIATFFPSGSSTSNKAISDIEFSDANNDNLMELVVSTIDNIYLINPITYVSKGIINQGATEISIGNVDTNSDIEIVTTFGKVLKYANGTVETKWSFYSNQSSDWGYMIELSDIDSDGMSEIVCARSWDYIDVYDADTKSLKYQINTDQDIEALLLADENNDQVDEIFYGDGQWGDISCHNASNGSLKWSIHNPEHGVTGLSLGDVDNDSQLEIMWGAGWTSTGSDYLYVASTITHNIEWQSAHIDGPFFAVKTGDIDNDGLKEIVAVSYESESGYESGIISIFNGTTHMLEWQSDGNFMNYIWTGVWDVELENVDNDSQMEIIVAADRLYDGVIWVIDGLTKTIEKSIIYPYNSNVAEFRAVEAEDFTGDSKKEILAVTEEHYYYIEPDYLSITYTSGTLYGGSVIAKIANINASAEKEIIIISGGRLIVHGCTSHTQLYDQFAGYTAITTFDVNNDNIEEIIVGNSTGQIEVLDGTSFQVIKQINLTNQRIEGIQLANLGNDSLPEYIFTSAGKLFILNDADKTIITDKMANITGAYNSLAADDINNDGVIELLVGTSFQVLEYNSDLYKCSWLSLPKTIQNVSCISNSDGSIQVSAVGSTGPYQYNWNNGSTSQTLNNLMVGTYIVTVQDAIGCVLVDTSLIEQSKIAATYSKTNEYCNPTQNGSATVLITQGSPPYSYLWSNGKTTATIGDLSSGTYSVQVIDAKSCTTSHTFQIDKDELDFTLNGQNVTCFGLSNGSIVPLIIKGTSPMTYNWSNGKTDDRLYFVDAGNYSLSMTDSHGCVQSQSIEITQPADLQLSVTIVKDNSTTPFGDGSASINVIGGTPPYTIQWNDPFYQTTVTAINLLSGPYQVTIFDSKNCSKTISFYLGGTNGIEDLTTTGNYSVFPNPTNLEKLFLKIDDISNHTLAVSIIDMNGRLVKFFPEMEVAPNQIVELITKDLNVGLYCLQIIIDNKSFSTKVSIIN